MQLTSYFAFPRQTGQEGHIGTEANISVQYPFSFVVSFNSMVYLLTGAASGRISCLSDNFHDKGSATCFHSSAYLSNTIYREPFLGKGVQN